MRMRQFLRSLWQHRQGGSPRPRPGRRAAVYRPLILEALEDRTVPSHASSHQLMSGAGLTGSQCQCSGGNTSGSSTVNTQLLQTLITNASTILNTLATDPTTGLTALV